MKAISPSMPVPPPARADASAAPTAADEAFGAVIAAALGIVQTAPSPQPQSTPRDSRDNGVDRIDRSNSTDRRDSTDRRNSPDSDGAVRDASASRGRGADHADAADSTPRADSTSTPSKPDDETPSASANSVKPEQLSGTAKTAAATGATAATAAVASPMLARASIALANALAVDAAKATPAGIHTAQNQLPAATLVVDGKAPSVTSPVPATDAKTIAGQAAPTQSGGQVAATPELAVAAAISSSGSGQALAGAAPQSIEQTAVAAQIGQPAATNVAGESKPAKAPGSDASTNAPRSTGLADATQAVAPGSGVAPLAANGHGGTAHHDGGAELGGSGVGGSNTHTAHTADVSGSPQVVSFDSALQAAAPTAPAPATPTAQPAAAPMPQGSVPEQIVQVVAPLRSAGNGNYTLALQLHPADLGPVTVHVAVNDGVLSVQLVPDQSHGHDALTSSLSDLRNQLQAGGMRVGDIDVATKASLAQQQNGQNSGQNAGQSGTSSQSNGNSQSNGSSQSNGNSQFGNGNSGEGSRQHAQSAFAQSDQTGSGTNASRHGDQPAFGGNRGPSAGSHRTDSVVDVSALLTDQLARSGRAAASDDTALDVRI
jgi:flagellar hook-length control protein FliK